MHGKEERKRYKILKEDRGKEKVRTRKEEKRGDSREGWKREKERNRTNKI
jgi:hypothetical protein